MLTNSRKFLKIFIDFEVDYSLPKFQRKATVNWGIEGSNPASGGVPMDNDMDARLNPSIPIQGGFANVSEDMISERELERISRASRVGVSNHKLYYIDPFGNCKSFNFWERLRYAFKGFDFSNVKPTKAPIPTITIEEFFHHIKNTPEEIRMIDSRSAGYLKALEQARKFNQDALVTELASQIEVVRNETQLYALGLVKVLSQEMVVQFANECEKGLSLDWIKNYTDMIPSKFLELKARLDELCIFDNYVILHYDPQKKAYKLTQEEIRKKGDPILFGVMKNSNKLYYIGDWINEHCDLTLDAFIQKFGEEAVSVNNIQTHIAIKQIEEELAIKK
jgi:hypothetical protein